MGLSVGRSFWRAVHVPPNFSRPSRQYEESASIFLDLPSGTVLVPGDESPTPTLVMREARYVFLLQQASEAAGWVRVTDLDVETAVAAARDSIVEKLPNRFRLLAQRVRLRPHTVIPNCFFTVKSKCNNVLQAGHNFQHRD